MARYKVRDDTTGKVISFEWHKDSPPTDSDFEEVFRAARNAPEPTISQEPPAPQEREDLLGMPEVSLSGPPEDKGSPRDVRAMAQSTFKNLVELPLWPARETISGAIMAASGKERLGTAGEMTSELGPPGMQEAETPEWTKLPEIPSLKSDEEAQAFITGLRDHVADFITDAIPSIVDDNWQPRVATAAEKKIEEQADSLLQIPLKYLAIVPEILGQGVTDKTGDPLLGKAVTVGALVGGMRVMHRNAAKQRGVRRARFLQEAETYKRLAEFWGEGPAKGFVLQETRPLESGNDVHLFKQMDQSIPETFGTTIALTKKAEWGQAEWLDYVKTRIEFHNATHREAHLRVKAARAAKDATTIGNSMVEAVRSPLTTEALSEWDAAMESLDRKKPAEKPAQKPAQKPKKPKPKEKAKPTEEVSPARATADKFIEVLERLAKAKEESVKAKHALEQAEKKAEKASKAAEPAAPTPTPALEPEVVPEPPPSPKAGVYIAKKNPTGKGKNAWMVIEEKSGKTIAYTKNRWEAAKKVKTLQSTMPSLAEERRAKDLGPLKRSVFDKTIDYKREIDSALNHGYSPVSIKNALYEAYANLSEAQGKEFKARYNEVSLYANQVYESWKKAGKPGTYSAKYTPEKPISTERVSRPVATEEGTTPAPRLEQRAGTAPLVQEPNLRRERRLKKEAKKTKEELKAKAKLERQAEERLRATEEAAEKVQDAIIPERELSPDEQAMSDTLSEMFSEMVDMLSDMEPGAAKLIPYPISEKGLKPAARWPDGTIVRIRGEAAGHQLFRKLTEKIEDPQNPGKMKYKFDMLDQEMLEWVEKNQADALGVVDPQGRFISIRDLSENEVRAAYEKRYGPYEGPGAKRKTGPEVETFQSSEEAAHWIDKMDWGKDAEWEFKSNVVGTAIRLVKKKGTESAKIYIDGNEFVDFKGKKGKKGWAKAVVRGLGSEKGHAFLLNEAAHAFVGLFDRYYIQKVAPHESPWKLASHPDYLKGKIASGEMRQGIATQEYFESVLDKAYKPVQKMFDRMSQDMTRNFIKNLEDGNHHLQASPELAELGKRMQQILQERWDVVVKMGGHQVWIENYWPHWWKKPGLMTRMKERMYGRRPLRGQATFKFSRKIPTFNEGIGRGLTPLSENPVDHFMWKIHEMNQWITGQRIFNNYKALSLVEYFKAGERPTADGWRPLEDSVAKVHTWSPTEKGFVKRGEYWAPSGVAAVFNNYLQPGLYGRNSLYTLLRGVTNTLNMAQLGLSAFHFTFTAMDAWSSAMSLALQELARGQPGLGLKRLATYPIAPALQLRKGIQMRRALFDIDNAREIAKRATSSLGAQMTPHNFTEYNALPWPFARKKGSMTVLTEIDPVMANMCNALLEGGGGYSLHRTFRTNAPEGFVRAMRQGKYFKGTALAFPAFFEALASPIMAFWVPRMKLGLFYEMAESQMRLWQKHQIEPSFAKRRAAFGQIWDSVDNRMGQLRYDNLHWNRTAKDIALLTFRAPGWNIGTVRELAGGAMDILTETRWQKDASGKVRGVAISPRTAYVAGLFGTVALAGALYNRARTGEWPTSVKDYWWPRTGRIKPDGTPERVQFASYMKDITAYMNHPFQTLMHKTSPLLNAMHEVYSNQDFYSVVVRDPLEPWEKQMLQGMKWVSRQFLPFSYRNYEQRKRAGMKAFNAKDASTWGKAAESFFGVLPAPTSVTRTKAESLANEINKAYFPRGPISPEEFQSRLDKGTLFRLADEGDWEAFNAAVKEMGMPRGVVKRIIRRSKKPKLVLDTMSIPASKIIHVWRAANDEEKRVLYPVITKKIRNARKAASITHDKGALILNEIQQTMPGRASTPQEIFVPKGWR